MAKEPANVVGPQIQKLRYDLGLTQEQLAARCQVKGLDISRETLAQIESRLRCVTDKELIFFANLFDVSIDGLFPIATRKRPRKRKRK